MVSGTTSPFTFIGTLGEAYAEIELLKRGIYVNRVSTVFDYDFISTTHKRIEVKTARPTVGKKIHKGKTYYSKIWQFRNYDYSNKPTSQQKGRLRECDIYLFVCLDENATYDRTYIVPAEQISGRLMITVSNKPSTPLQPFLNRWELLK